MFVHKHRKNNACFCSASLCALTVGLLGVPYVLQDTFASILYLVGRRSDFTRSALSLSCRCLGSVWAKVGESGKSRRGDHVGVPSVAVGSLLSYHVPEHFDLVTQSKYCSGETSGGFMVPSVILSSNPYLSVRIHIRRQLHPLHWTRYLCASTIVSRLRISSCVVGYHHDR